MGSDPKADNPLVRRAERFAESAHGSIGHVRKYTAEPYIVHLRAVARLVESVPHTSAMLAAAYLHDVVEDVPSIDIEEITKQFGGDVGVLVGWLTDVSIGLPDNRRTRKELDKQHLAQAPSEAQTIKLADIIDNALSIKSGDRKFWPVYRNECLQLISVLEKGDASLLQMAKQALD